MKKLQAVASRKLAFVGSCAGLVVADAVTRGWSAAHLLAVAILGAGYALGQGLSDLGENLGFKAQKARQETPK